MSAKLKNNFDIQRDIYKNGISLKTHLPREKIEFYDTTLRDGNQTVGVNFSLDDKIKISRKLDEIGIDYVEGGWPNSTNIAEMDYFRKIQKENLSLKIAAFGRTRKPRLKIQEDHDLQILIESNPDIITLMGKCWSLHVEKILGTSLQENLRMIKDTIIHFRDSGFRVFFSSCLMEGSSLIPDTLLRFCELFES